MTMPGLRQERGDGDDSSKKPVVQHPTLPKTSPLIPNSQQRKHWAKQYRTEIAASTSSVLSTFAAVSDRSLQKDGFEYLLMWSSTP